MMAFDVIIIKIVKKYALSFYAINEENAIINVLNAFKKQKYAFVLHNMQIFK